MNKSIRFLLILFSFLLIITSTFAQSPGKFSYQAVIRDAGNNLVTGQTIGMQISILQGSPTGTMVYSETRTPVTNANGLVSVEIGGGEGFSSIGWKNGPYYLKTEIDPAGGSNYTITATSLFPGVPYALHSEVSESADDAVKLTGDQTIGGTKKFSYTIKAMNGIDANNKAVTNVAEPVGSQDVATKAYVDLLDARIEELEVAAGTENKVMDADGNIYLVVQIGTQKWMTENLRTTRFSYGTSIPLVTDDTKWSTLTTAGYCWYENNRAYGNTYGALYNWYALSWVCPTGWHVPTDADWTTLTTYLGSESVAGGKLKESGTTHWSTPNTGATNLSGFFARPGGSRFYRDTLTFNFLGGQAYFWSTTQGRYSGTAWYRRVSYDSQGVFRSDSDPKGAGMAVRCVKN